MVSVDRTSEFTQLCAARPPPTKRRRGPGGSKPGDEQQAAVAKAYVAEGYAILKHVTTLGALLARARRPYLNVDAHQSMYSRQARNFDLASGRAAGVFAGVKQLTNEERDQIDLQARMILGRCADRVKEMEILEKRRQAAVAAQSNPLVRLLPSRLLASSESNVADAVAAHRSNITWYLTRRLADASQTQKEMQEERIKRQVERAKTLGSSSAATYESDMLAGATNNPVSIRQQSSSSNWSGASSGLAALTGSFMRGNEPTSSMQSQYGRLPPEDAGASSDDEEDLELTPGQILQFEQENAVILRSVEDTLASARLAESRLLDISALQTELIVQLTKQTEMVDQLYDDAISTQGEVDKGHVQLKQARDRARESRKWILVFILGATGAMLFLHWYD